MVRVDGLERARKNCAIAPTPPDSAAGSKRPTPAAAAAAAGNVCDHGPDEDIIGEEVAGHKGRAAAAARHWAAFPIGCVASAPAMVSYMKKAAFVQLDCSRDKGKTALVDSERHDPALEVPAGVAENAAAEAVAATSAHVGLRLGVGCEMRLQVRCKHSLEALAAGSRWHVADVVEEREAKERRIERMPKLDVGICPEDHSCGASVEGRVTARESAAQCVMNSSNLANEQLADDEHL